ncbi:hypothetical protein F4778DRAFT_766030 [Xylariomycetidae sp. FL2044]|nr:hypothetical protein F4778DRAFT_766030 [Xylariomycetidae sp. FL2044]
MSLIGADRSFGRITNIFERDECSDVFGIDAHNSICAPSNTLCCVRNQQAFPSCQQYLEKGWCCVGNGKDDDCYVDQESECETANSVPCTDLPSGVDEACCPPLTSCVDGYTSSSGVRCQINRNILIKVDASSTTTSTATSTLTTSSTSSSSSSRTSTTTTPIPDTTSSSPSRSAFTQGSSSSSPSPAPSSPETLSGGAIAGIVVGALAGLALLLLAAYFLMRRRKARDGGAQVVQGSTANTIAANNTESKPEGYVYAGRQPRHELDGYYQPRPHELDGQGHYSG